MTTRVRSLLLGVCLISLSSCKKESADSKPPGDDAADKGGAAAEGKDEAAGGGAEPAQEEFLSVDGFEETMLQRQGEMADCFDAAKQANPKLAGKLALEVTIGGDGSVTDVKIDPASTLKDEGANTCVQQKVKGWKFPKTRDGKDTTLPYAMSMS